VFHVLVLRALITACATDLGTDPADRSGELGASRHERCSQAADVGAVAVELNTTGKHRRLLFVKTCRCALLALGCAGVTGTNTAIHGFV